MELFPAGRGEDENLRGGAKVKICGAGKKHVNRLIQKFDKSENIFLFFLSQMHNLPTFLMLFSGIPCQVP